MSIYTETNNAIQESLYPTSTIGGLGTINLVSQFTDNFNGITFSGQVNIGVQETRPIARVFVGAKNFEDKKNFFKETVNFIASPEFQISFRSKFSNGDGVISQPNNFKQNYGIFVGYVLTDNEIAQGNDGFIKATKQVHNAFVQTCLEFQETTHIVDRFENETILS